MRLTRPGTDGPLPPTLPMGAADLAYRRAVRGGALPLPVVFVFDGPAPALDTVRARVAERAPHVPAANYRPSREGKVFRRVDRIAVERHVREVRLTGDTDCTATGRLLLSRPMSVADGPLWEVWLVHGAGGGHALCYRTDHRLQDGMGAVYAARALLDDDPASGPPAQALARPAPRGVAGVLGDVLRSLGRPVAKPGFDGPVGPGLRVCHATTPLARLRAAGRVQGGSVNDVYLTALSHAVRTWHLKATGETHPPLPVAVPMSVRAPGEEYAPGNRIALAHVVLPCDEAVPQRAFRRVRQSTERLREGRRRDSFRLLLAATPRPVGARLGVRLVTGTVVAAPVSRVDVGAPLVHRGAASRWSAAYTGTAAGIRCMVTLTSQQDVACLTVVHDETLAGAEELPDLWLAALLELERS
ncbi:wax ester/triacylglycerol synthase domain-containing protein [Streptomyces fumanus]|uniref:Condensation protein n=1 Tax=Streptomyces fumanus TaxID=67302 RepID=A0A919AYC8_9ACTN|nr:wax ester/triacylglycerol synthase domain-containing protein [Streptomyces fumanus]GHF29112.1 condensation protein [Streptomyces fumanus]